MTLFYSFRIHSGIQAREIPENLSSVSQCELAPAHHSCGWRALTSSWLESHRLFLWVVSVCMFLDVRTVLFSIKSVKVSGVSKFPN